MASAEKAMNGAATKRVSEVEFKYTSCIEYPRKLIWAAPGLPLNKGIYRGFANDQIARSNRPAVTE
jgi:hypothetical protein